MKVLTLIIFLMLAGCTQMERDNSDGPKERSGLTIYTDALTGCQYLGVAVRGGLTPRMYLNGEQICLVNKK
jgi:hypothetical protein